MNRVEFFIKLGRYQDMQASKEENNSLEHQGIKGQKWGVRRWQNADGTFNEAGKERYFGKGSKKLGSQDQKIGSRYARQNFINENVWKDRAKRWTSREEADRDFEKLEELHDEFCAERDWNTGHSWDSEERKKYEHYDELARKTGKLIEELDDKYYSKLGGQPGKIGGFGLSKEFYRNSTKGMNDKEISNRLDYMKKHIEDDDEFNTEMNELMNEANRRGIKFGSQADAKDDIKSTIKGMFSKKNNLSDKIREQAKKLREVGEDELADKYEKHAKEMDQYKKIGHAPGATEQEIKEARRAATNAYATAMRNKWPLFFLFGPIGGAIIGSIASNAKINKMIDQLGLDRQNKDKFTASDWDAINEAIKESRRKKKKTETSAE